MKKINNYILEKLHINKDSKLKSHDHLYNIEHDKIRPQMEEYGYYYGSDYDIDIARDESFIDIYMLENTYTEDELNNISYIILDVLMENNIDTGNIVLHETEKPQKIHIEIYI